ncbi:MAG: hypothetical protein MJ241_06790 [Bacilli bacterium]|nr:hypothetical protein [Bacilli bacterium]
MKQFLVCESCGKTILHEEWACHHIFKNEAEWNDFKSLKTDEEVSKFFKRKFDLLRANKVYQFIAKDLFPVVCPNCGHPSLDAFVPLGAVDKSKEEINHMVNDKELKNLVLPFGTFRFQTFIMLGYAYKKLGLFKSAETVLLEAKYLESTTPIFNVYHNPEEKRNKAITKIESLQSDF